MEIVDLNSHLENVDGLIKDGRIWQARERLQKIINALKKTADTTDIFEKKQQFYDDISKFFDVVQRIHIIGFKFKDYSEQKENITCLPNLNMCPFKQILGKYLNENVKEVHITETLDYVQNEHESLIQFLQVLHNNCSGLKFVKLFIKNEPNVPKGRQMDVQQRVAKFLREKKIKFQFEFDLWTHVEHKIFLSTGYIFELSHSIHNIFEARKDLMPKEIRVGVWYTTALQQINLN